jgi:hypothetical protein
MVYFYGVHKLGQPYLLPLARYANFFASYYFCYKVYFHFEGQFKASPEK